jgi:uncharacterized protein
MDELKHLIDTLAIVLSRDPGLVFAYLYGSAARSEGARDIDIAVYTTGVTEHHEHSAELKIALGREMGISPDTFDVRIINDLVEKGDLFSLLYLRNILTANLLIVDRDEVLRSDFIESFNLKYRECEGLIDEVLR